MALSCEDHNDCSEVSGVKRFCSSDRTCKPLRNCIDTLSITGACPNENSVVSNALGVEEEVDSLFYLRNLDLGQKVGIIYDIFRILYGNSPLFTLESIKAPVVEGLTRPGDASLEYIDKTIDDFKIETIKTGLFTFSDTNEDIVNYLLNIQEKRKEESSEEEEQKNNLRTRNTQRRVNSTTPLEKEQNNNSNTGYTEVKVSSTTEEEEQYNNSNTGYTEVKVNSTPNEQSNNSKTGFEEEEQYNNSNTGYKEVKVSSTTEEEEYNNLNTGYTEVKITSS